MVPMPPSQAQQNPWLALAFAADRLDAADTQGAAAFLHLAQQAWPDAQPRSVMAAFRIAHVYQSDDLTDAEDLTAPPEPPASAGPAGVLAALAVGSARLFDGETLCATATLRAFAGDRAALPPCAPRRSP